MLATDRAGGSIEWKNKCSRSPLREIVADVDADAKVQTATIMAAIIGATYFLLSSRIKYYTIADFTLSIKSAPSIP